MLSCLEKNLLAFPSRAHCSPVPLEVLYRAVIIAVQHNKIFFILWRTTVEMRRRQKCCGIFATFLEVKLHNETNTARATVSLKFLSDFFLFLGHKFLRKESLNRGQQFPTPGGDAKDDMNGLR